MDDAPDNANFRAGACRPDPSVSDVQTPGRHGPALKRPFPIAYHITWGTYGTRLHGDPRGTVCRDENVFGEPIINADNEWRQEEAARLKFPSRVLSESQRRHVEQIAEGICQRGNWRLRAIAAAPDHVHGLVHALVDGKDVRKWLKRWLSESLSQLWPLRPDEAWWSECGSVKWIWTQDYYERARRYINKQRTIQ
jgi:REP element-mobilizing transposase RayT